MGRARHRPPTPTTLSLKEHPPIGKPLILCTPSGSLGLPCLTLTILWSMDGVESLHVVC